MHIDLYKTGWYNAAQKWAEPTTKRRTLGMKDHRDRTARLQLIESMFAGNSWQTAVAQSQLHVSRSTSYRLVQLARDEEKAERAFLDDRHGHVYKVTEPVQAWMIEFCTDHPQIESNLVHSELQKPFGV